MTESEMLAVGVAVGHVDRETGGEGLRVPDAQVVGVSAKDGDELADAVDPGDKVGEEQGVAACVLLKDTLTVPEKHSVPVRDGLEEAERAPVELPEDDREGGMLPLAHPEAEIEGVEEGLGGRVPEEEGQRVVEAHPVKLELGDLAPDPVPQAVGVSEGEREEDSVKGRVAVAHSVVEGVDERVSKAEGERVGERLPDPLPEALSVPDPEAQKLEVGVPDSDHGAVIEILGDCEAEAEGHWE